MGSVCDRHACGVRRSWRLAWRQHDGLARLAQWTTRKKKSLVAIDRFKTIGMASDCIAVACMALRLATDVLATGDGTPSGRQDYDLARAFYHAFMILFSVKIIFIALLVLRCAPPTLPP